MRLVAIALRFAALYFALRGDSALGYRMESQSGLKNCLHIRDSVRKQKKGKYFRRGGNQTIFIDIVI